MKQLQFRTFTFETRPAAAHKARFGGKERAMRLMMMVALVLVTMATKTALADGKYADDQGQFPGETRIGDSYAEIPKPSDAADNKPDDRLADASDQTQEAPKVTPAPTTAKPAPKKAATKSEERVEVTDEGDDLALEVESDGSTKARITVEKTEVKELANGGYITIVDLTEKGKTTQAIKIVFNGDCSVTIPAYKGPRFTCPKVRGKYPVLQLGFMTAVKEVRAVMEVTENITVMQEFFDDPEKLAGLVTGTKTFDRESRRVANEEIDANGPHMVREQLKVLGILPKPDADKAPSSTRKPGKDKKKKLPPRQAPPAPPIKQGKESAEVRQTSDSDMFGNTVSFLREHLVLGGQASLLASPVSPGLSPYSLGLELTLDVNIVDGWMFRVGYGLHGLFDSEDADEKPITTLPPGLESHVFRGYSLGIGRKWNATSANTLETLLVYRRIGAEEWQVKDVGVWAAFNFTPSFGVGAEVFWSLANKVEGGAQGLYPNGAFVIGTAVTGKFWGP